MMVRMGRSFVVFYKWGAYCRGPSNLGLSVAITRQPPLFSERNGFRKVRRLGPLKLEILK